MGSMSVPEWPIEHVLTGVLSVEGAEMDEQNNIFDGECVRFWQTGKSVSMILCV